MNSISKRIIRQIKYPIRFLTTTPSTPQPPTDESSTPTELSLLQSQLTEKEAQIQELKNLYRSALADCENIRKRTAKEIDDTAAFSIQKFASDLLDTSDFLSLALNSVSTPELESNKPLKDLYTGIKLTRSEMTKTFKKYGIVEYDPMGLPFDANLHQALYQAPVPDKTPGTIFEVEKTGFKILERILRPAHVGVVQEQK